MQNPAKDPICELKHRMIIKQCSLFCESNRFICCDSRECPYKMVEKHQKVCLFEDKPSII